MASRLVHTAAAPPQPRPGAATRRGQSKPPSWKSLNYIHGALHRLAQLGRRGHWVLHTLDFYRPDCDTRPQSRDPAREVPIRDAARPGQPVLDSGLIWAGSLPAPAIDDVAFWNERAVDVKDKLAQANEKRICPAFTPAELAALRAVEHDEHGESVLHFIFLGRSRKMQATKNVVLANLIELAERHRPGQWILHIEDFYHPDIDTRPQTRLGNRGIAISGTTSPKLTAGVELRWAGRGPQPDLDDGEFWDDAAERLSQKVQQVRDGNVHPAFTAAETRVLEDLENQEDHYFHECLIKVKHLAPEREAEARVHADARRRVRELLIQLWKTGLPGQWILHNLDVFASEYSTHHASQNAVGVDCEPDDNGGMVCPVHPIMGESYPGTFGLYYRGAARPPAELGSADYWLKLASVLDKKHKDVQRGRIVEHRFTSQELQMLELADRAHDPVEGEMDEKQKLDNRVTDWLSRDRRGTTPLASDTAGVFDLGEVAFGEEAVNGDSASEAGTSATADLSSRSSRKRTRPLGSNDEDALPSSKLVNTKGEPDQDGKKLPKTLPQGSSKGRNPEKVGKQEKKGTQTRGKTSVPVLKKAALPKPKSASQTILRRSARLEGQPRKTYRNNGG
ncbi:hypothetical protein SEUCBS140593_001062 [Sporothrix eucalyptigena]|uniref:Uncharacterized protein n=1 Tax=Sporothrix eucalyptigena TaxID=1812306 RepID=A0ABP0AV64_9PEZI